MTKRKVLKVVQEQVISKILIIRNQRVILDRDLAVLYGVETKVLNQAVDRNQKRFPVDFMFKLSQKEIHNLKSQFVTSSLGWGGRRKQPRVFTEQGVAMLSSVLNSNKAITVNIQIMRAFTKLREILLTHEDLRKKIEEMENKYDQQFQDVFETIRRLISVESKPKKLIGFKTKDRLLDSGSSPE
ncbi:MAG: ORF6N domain-containing protein [candidate division WWE3 bacterium]|nr:ORF6N domain-containing protein [candidate division WWE3 bacterium]